MIPKKNFQINNPCPFCLLRNYSYKYKNWYGLLRHIHRFHLKIKNRNRGFENSWWNIGSLWKSGDLIYIRVWTKEFSEYYDIEIKSPQECERALYWYVTNNPSFRQFRKNVGQKK